MTKEFKILLALSFGVIVFSIISWFPGPEAKDYVRTALNVLLCSFVLLGHNWARWVMGVLAGLGGLASIIFLAKLDLGSDGEGYLQILMLLIMGVFYIFYAYVLLSKTLVKKHFEVKSA